MSDTIALIASMSLFALLYASQTKKTKENFAGLHVPMTTKVQREVYLPCRDNMPSINYSVEKNYQASLPPRFCSDPGLFRSRIRCTGIDAETLPFDPDHPLEHRRVVDQIRNNCPAVPLCGSKGTPAPSNCVRNSCGGDQAVAEPFCDDRSMYNALPVCDMRTVQAVAYDQLDTNVKNRILAEDNQLCSADNPIIYDRLIYANARSRLKFGSDYIRGDLPIVPVLPDSNPESLSWFRPACNPRTDLNFGALNVLGGQDNGTQHELLALMQQCSAGTLGAFSGQAVQARTVSCDKNSDIQVLSFP